MKAAAALVTGRHDADAGVAQGVEQPEERLAGHREGVPDAGGTQRIGDEPPDRPRADGGLDLGHDLGTGPVGRHLDRLDRLRHVRRRGLGLGLDDGVAREVSPVPVRRRVREVVRTGDGRCPGDLAVDPIGGVLDRGLGRRSGVELAHGSGVSSAGRRTACVSTPAGRRWPT